MIVDDLLIVMLLPEWPEVTVAARRRALADTVASVRKAMARAPFHVRLGVSLLSVVIGFLLRLRLLGHRGASERMRCGGVFLDGLQRWPGPLSSVVRLYRSTVLIAYYEHPDIAPEVNAQARVV